MSGLHCRSLGCSSFAMWGQTLRGGGKCVQNSRNNETQETTKCRSDAPLAFSSAIRPGYSRPELLLASVCHGMDVPCVLAAMHVGQEWRVDLRRVGSSFRGQVKYWASSRPLRHGRQTFENWWRLPKTAALPRHWLRQRAVQQVANPSHSIQGGDPWAMACCGNAKLTTPKKRLEPPNPSRVKGMFRAEAEGPKHTASQANSYMTLRP